jgi:D-aspartate ligase
MADNRINERTTAQCPVHGLSAGAKMGNAGRFDKSAKAVIYPARTVSGYGHIYSLGIAGIPVTALAHVDCANFKSRYVREKHVVPDPRVDHEKFVHWLMDYGSRQTTKPVLFMAEDPYAYLASLYHDQLRKHFLFPYIPLDKIDIYFRKDAMYRKAAEAGVRFPRTIYSSETTAVSGQWPSFPAVVKPVISRFRFKGRTFVALRTFPELFGCKAVLGADRDETERYIQQAEAAGIECCIQEYIPGDNTRLYTIYFVADKQGRIPSFSTHYKVRQYPVDFGTTSVSRSETVPLLLEYAEQFCHTTGYSGPATMEFKLNSKNGLWYLMEINARLGFSIRRSTLKGVNMPLQQYLLSTDQQLLKVKQRDDNRCWIDIPGDIKGIIWRRKKTLWRLSFWQIVKPYLFFHEAVFNFRDPLPGFERFFSSLRRRFASAVRNLRRTG